MDEKRRETSGIIKLMRKGNVGAGEPERFYGYEETIPARKGLYVLDKLFDKPVRAEVLSVGADEAVIIVDGQSSVLAEGLNLVREQSFREVGDDGKAFWAKDELYALYTPSEKVV